MKIILILCFFSEKKINFSTEEHRLGPLLLKAISLSSNIDHSWGSARRKLRKGAILVKPLNLSWISTWAQKYLINTGGGIRPAPFANLLRPNLAQG